MTNLKKIKLPGITIDPQDPEIYEALVIAGWTPTKHRKDVPPPKLPDRPIWFNPKDERSFRSWCRVLRYGPVQYGEFFLGSSKNMAHKAMRDLDRNHFIVKPIPRITPKVHLHEYYITPTED